MDNVPVETPRRRFLSLAGATTTALLAGCTSDTSRSTTETTTGTTSATGGTTAETTGTTETTTNPKPTLRTKYNSRERYGSPGTSFDAFENPSHWKTLEGEKTPDRKTKHTGPQCLRLVGTDGHHVILQREFTEAMDFSNHDMSAMVRTTTLDKIGFYIYLLDAAGNYAVLELRDITYRKPDIGWFRTCPGVFKTSETEPDLTNITRIKLQVTNATSDDVEAWVDDVRFHPKPEKGYIVLSWDDGKRSYYEHAAPVDDKYDLPAVLTQPPQPEAVEHDIFMSIEELQERQSKGDEIAAHGSVKNPFGEISASKLDGILRRNKQWLLNNEFGGADFIVYPGNNFDKTALEGISKYHYMGGMNQSGNVNTTGVHGFDPLVLPRTTGHDLEISKRVVDNVANHRNCGILNFHDFTNGNTMSVSEYEKLLAHIDSTSGVEVITFSDLWRMRTDTTA
ncbi:polysaccharide deacetylase family protein [Haladaptatus sp. DFWS20]|uniref:polysaccharide deacetylase family protein n=1 Tax=Haladaptatus sp. DFWS20 TaxID=3403467 RepID=UPI003EBC6805